jgi:L-seryl-tRNA(Ser) seleniumtransferase
MPSVSTLLERADVQALLEDHPRAVVVNAIRGAIEDARTDSSRVAHSDWVVRIQGRIADAAANRSLRRVINATGVVLHTNLGRAPLPARAVDAIAAMASGYSNLEYDLATGARGSRYVHCVEILRELTGAEDAIVANNCAAALVLSLSAIARGREVIVSRGELVEIGGSFRVPDIMQRSGATLIEVGTTNRTHLDDYRRAISPRTGAIAKIHRSNFAITGFVADVGVASLRPLAAEHDIPIVHDLGSGLMLDLSRFGLSGEPTARQALEAGATLVLMSGDKLLGGPQAGIIVGKAREVARLKQDPFARAMRVDKLTIAALTATLELYRDERDALREIPALTMLTALPESIRARCEQVRHRLAAHSIESRVIASEASVGGGAFPAASIPSFAVAFEDDAAGFELRLRGGATPVVGRVADGSLLLDLRSVSESEDGALGAAVIAAHA